LPFFRCRFTVAVAVAAAVAYLFAVYGCNGTEFSDVIFTEQRNFTTAEQRNGNGRTATEWWKPGISRSYHWLISMQISLLHNSPCSYNALLETLVYDKQSVVC